MEADHVEVNSLEESSFARLNVGSRHGLKLVGKGRGGLSLAVDISCSMGQFGSLWLLD